MPKESGRFDLPIVLGILAASHQIRGEQLDRYEFAGELRPIRGALALSFACGFNEPIAATPIPVGSRLPGPLQALAQQRAGLRSIGAGTHDARASGVRSARLRH